MAFDRTPLKPKQAEAILSQWLGRPVSPTRIERMSGGMINSVLALHFDVPPHEAVIKIAAETGAGRFAHEAEVLQWLRAHTDLPVPEVYLHQADGATVPVSFILMERLPGTNLGRAMLSKHDRADIDLQMAQALLDLHSHQRGTFGGLFGRDQSDHWLDVFLPRMRSNYPGLETRISPRAYRQIGRILDQLGDIFDPEGKPTLVHGDIWATNVIVAEHNGRWRLTGFVDPGAHFADVEYELAYLEVFQTVTPAFFKHYARVSPLRDGYERRRLVYWLNTMMVHVNVFGDAHYVHNTERLAEAVCREWQTG